MRPLVTGVSRANLWEFGLSLRRRRRRTTTTTASPPNHGSRRGVPRVGSLRRWPGNAENGSASSVGAWRGNGGVGGLRWCPDAARERRRAAKRRDLMWASFEFGAIVSVGREPRSL